MRILLNMKHSWSAIRWRMLFIFAFFSVLSMILVACFAVAILNVVIRRETAYLIEERIKVIVDGRKELTGSLVDRVSGCQGRASDAPLFTEYLEAVRPESEGLVSVLPKGAHHGVSSTWHDTGWFAGIVADRQCLPRWEKSHVRDGAASPGTCHTTSSLADSLAGRLLDHHHEQHPALVPSAAGRLVITIMAAVSQWEREAIGERTVEVGASGLL